MHSYYDEIARGYDELYQEEQEEKVRFVKEILEKRAEKIIGPSLDVGCGTGIALREWGLFGVDPSFRLLNNIQGGVVQAEAEHLPFPDHSFVWVVSLTALQNFIDPRRGLEEMKRVGQGKQIISFPKKSPKRATLTRMLREVFPTVEMIEQKRDIFCIVLMNI
jgi:ubiquinone/menaquinone biosynthesis C-methylase UbiE